MVCIIRNQRMLLFDKRKAAHQSPAVLADVYHILDSHSPDGEPSRRLCHQEYGGHGKDKIGIEGEEDSCAEECFALIETLDDEGFGEADGYFRFDDSDLEYLVNGECIVPFIQELQDAEYQLVNDEPDLPVVQELPEHSVVLQSNARTGPTLATRIYRTQIRGKRRRVLKPDKLPEKLQALCDALKEEGIDASVDQVQFVIEISKHECGSVLEQGGDRVFKRFDEKNQSTSYYKEADEVDILNDFRGRKRSKKQKPFFSGPVDELFFARAEEAVKSHVDEGQGRKEACETFMQHLTLFKTSYTTIASRGDPDKLKEFERSCVNALNSIRDVTRLVADAWQPSYS